MLLPDDELWYSTAVAISNPEGDGSFDEEPEMLVLALLTDPGGPKAPSIAAAVAGLSPTAVAADGLLRAMDVVPVVATSCLLGTRS